MSPCAAAFASCSDAGSAAPYTLVFRIFGGVSARRQSPKQIGARSQGGEAEGYGDQVEQGQAVCRG